MVWSHVRSVFSLVLQTDFALSSRTSGKRDKELNQDLNP
jgi:hypothetical protein